MTSKYQEYKVKAGQLDAIAAFIKGAVVDPETTAQGSIDTFRLLNGIELTIRADGTWVVINPPKQRDN